MAMSEVERDWARALLSERAEKGAAVSEKRYYIRYVSPIGNLRCESDGSEITKVLFDGFEAASERDELCEYIYGEGRPELCALTSWLDLYFSDGAAAAKAEKPAFSLRGSDFRKRVLELVSEIAFGETKSYGELAAQIAAERGIPKMSAQAVGNAVGGNELLLLVPCHRVVASGGKLGGYGGRSDIKLKLLRHEGRGDFG